MARSDLLIEMVRAGAKGDTVLFRKALEAMIAEERAKQHNVLADRLSEYLSQSFWSSKSIQSSFRNGSSTNLFHEIQPKRHFEDMILPETVKTACEEIIEEQHRSDLLRAHSIDPRNRILLTGPPGNGKTSLAEVIATEMAIPMLVVRYEAVIASYLGETAVRLSRLFEEVRTRRCVLFFDEFDVVGKERGDIHETGEIKRVVSSLLLQIDALPSYVVVITATNHPELLDRAVWRRFQVRLELPKPTQKQIQEWFNKFEVKIGENIGVAESTLSSQLKNLSYSEIEQFGEDIVRRFVLSQPGAELKKITSARLKQWKDRFDINNTT